MFSWSQPNKRASGSKKTYTRQQHITSYLTDPILKPSTRKINDSTYDTVFLSKDQSALILRVHMPNNATISAPKMTLVGIRAVHPWIDSKMKVIGYSNVIGSSADFVKSGILLGAVVNHVVQHFQLNPPTQLVIVDLGLKRLQESLTGNASGNANANENEIANASASAQKPNHQTSAPPPPAYGATQGDIDIHVASQRQLSVQSQIAEPEYELPPHFRSVLALDDSSKHQITATLQNLKLPTVSSAMPTIEAMTAETDRATMTKCADDPNTHLVPNLMTLRMIQEMEEIKQTMMEANVSIADKNLKAKDGDSDGQPFQSVKELSEEVKTLQSSLKDKMEQMNELQRKQMDLCRPMDTAKIRKRLKKAKLEAFQESEETASEWLDGDCSGVEKFLETFLETRTIHHVRAAKMERLEHA